MFSTQQDETKSKAIYTRSSTFINTRREEQHVPSRTRWKGRWEGNMNHKHPILFLAIRRNENGVFLVSAGSWSDVSGAREPWEEHTRVYTRGGVTADDKLRII